MIGRSNLVHRPLRKPEVAARAVGQHVPEIVDDHHLCFAAQRLAGAPLPDHVYGRIAELLAQCPHRDGDNNGSMWSLGWIRGDVVGSIGPRGTAYIIATR